MKSSSRARGSPPSVAAIVEEPTRLSSRQQHATPSARTVAVAVGSPASSQPRAVSTSPGKMQSLSLHSTSEGMFSPYGVGQDRARKGLV